MIQLFFPNIRVMITPLARRRRPGSERYCSLWITHSIRITTLTALFRIPILWRAAEKDPWRGVFSHIADVQLEDGNNAWVLGKGFDDTRPYVIPADVGIHTVYHLRHQDASDNLYRTLCNLFWLTLASDSLAGQSGVMESTKPFWRFQSLDSLSVVNMLLEMASLVDNNDFYPSLTIAMNSGWIADIGQVQDVMNNAAELQRHIHRTTKRTIRLLRDTWSFQFEHRTPQGASILGRLVRGNPRLKEFTLKLSTMDEHLNLRVIQDEIIPLELPTDLTQAG
ncbi:hypothetical protein QFC22_005139 [Naganishia vaughanmartiniae]|uniref:Uncharacterized protein n=1 Tax=Naganishia vaughanmartiniae TaxID=1424756 RepID=A0ACC2WW57_9TREE|nr:hypothetical protein QFC22_005139 [Naganishia vaughanmartiniae]